MKSLQTLLNKNGANLDVDGVVGSRTLKATQDFVIKELTKRNFVIPETGFVFLRLDQTLTDTFDDIVIRFNKGTVDKVAPCSTTAGDYYRLNPITYQGITGTAIACEQQVLKSHRFVTSRTWTNLWTRMPYFQQVRPISIFRDGDKDNLIDKAIRVIGMYGINFHRGWKGNRNWNCSAGCQIVPDQYWTELVTPFIEGKDYDFTLIEV